MAILDTHAVVEEFIAVGIDKKQAEVIVRTMNQTNNNLVTKFDLDLALTKLKSDLKDETSSLRSELKEDVNSLRSELKEDIAELRSEIMEVKTNFKWIYIAGGGIIGLLINLTYILMNLKP
jgi:hypothetical protein